MTEVQNEITITIPVTQAAQHHIDGLQATLTKRNYAIERLTRQLEEALTGEPNQKALAAAYKRGWQAAAGHLMTATGATAVSLGKLHKDAWAIYLQAENRDFNEPH